MIIKLLLQVLAGQPIPALNWGRPRQSQLYRTPLCTCFWRDKNGVHSKTQSLRITCRRSSLRGPNTLYDEPRDFFLSASG